jgi:hypothetical protein
LTYHPAATFDQASGEKGILHAVAGSVSQATLVD